MVVSLVSYQNKFFVRFFSPQKSLKTLQLIINKIKAWNSYLELVL